MTDDYYAIIFAIMNFSAFQFPLFALLLTYLALLTLVVLSGGQPLVLLSFAPLAIWIAVLVLKGRM